MSLAVMIDAIETAVISKENLGIIKGRIVAAREQAVAMERDYTDLQVKYDKLVETNSNQQAEIAHLKAIVAPSALSGYEEKEIIEGVFAYVQIGYTGKL